MSEVLVWKALIEAEYIGGKKVEDGFVSLTYQQAEYPLMQGHITRVESEVVVVAAEEEIVVVEPEDQRRNQRRK